MEKDERVKCSIYEGATGKVLRKIRGEIGQYMVEVLWTFPTGGNLLSTHYPWELKSYSSKPDN